ncbi:hypothetical protein D3H65_07980 [Paraflavitalea soli]|uniref:Uncharacterized protein n=1 Tax=Paraflavitalea soli TaxID=2315862 RepID=A0A3B7MHQ6_9BACT|nr:hypothetical protein D3H65_07980 [Paraflavitalea soli]
MFAVVVIYINFDNTKLAGFCHPFYQVATSLVEIYFCNKRSDKTIKKAISVARYGYILPQGILSHTFYQAGK